MSNEYAAMVSSLDGGEPCFQDAWRIRQWGSTLMIPHAGSMIMLNGLRVPIAGISFLSQMGSRHGPRKFVSTL